LQSLAASSAQGFAPCCCAEATAVNARQNIPATIANPFILIPEDTDFMRRPLS
jgi:hypothetical protein